MPRPKGAPKTGGRTKGTPNGTTQDVRDAILQVADGLGGAEAMLTWAKADPVNERIYWSQIFPKLLPKEVKQEVSGPDGGPIEVSEIRINLVKPDAG